MTPLRDRLTRIVDAAGPAGIAGIALLVAAATAWVSTITPARHERDQLERAADQSARQLRSAVDPGRTGSAREQLGAFHAFFPAAHSTPEWLAKIHEAAAKRGVQLAAGEYRVSRSPGTRLVRYQITLPVQGTYPQIRGFVAGVLESVPAAAVDEVSLKREAVTSPRLEARVRITLFLAGGGESGS